ncbi:MAG TPA: hypothetical protein V6D22_15795 [Candidatus Obscuribacterales bacterium]
MSLNELGSGDIQPKRVASNDEPDDTRLASLSGGEILMARAGHHHHSHDDEGGGRHSRGGKHHKEHKHHDYWSRVAEARHHGGFISEFPPVHPGIDNPKAFFQSDSLHPKQGANPSLNDLSAASRSLLREAYGDKKHGDFSLNRVDEDTFKQRYAREAVRIGAQFGFDKKNVQNVVQRIYAFEDGGWGTYETLSSMPQNLLLPENQTLRNNYHPLSSAIGYNQLMLFNSVADVKQNGDAMASRIQEKATKHPDDAKDLSDKADLLKALHDRKAGNDRALHALNLDGDIGPVLQSLELGKLFKFAKDNDFESDLGKIAARINANAAKYDALSPQEKQAAADEVMRHIKKPADITDATAPNTQTWESDRDDLKRRVGALPVGDSDLLNRENLTPGEYGLINTQLMRVRKFGGESGPLSPHAKLLMDKLDTVYFHGVSADSLMPAAIELANLAGMETAKNMLKDGHTELPTSNFFSRAGYDGNPVVARRSSEELLMQINRIMYGPNASETHEGIRQFENAFSNIPDQP